MFCDEGGSKKLSDFVNLHLNLESITLLITIINHNHISDNVTVNNVFKFLEKVNRNVSKIRIFKFINVNANTYDLVITELTKRNSKSKKELGFYWKYNQEELNNEEKTCTLIVEEMNTTKMNRSISPIGRPIV